MQVITKFIEVKINNGWLGGSAVNKMNNFINNVYPDWEIVNAVPNYVNPLRRLWFTILGFITLGIYVPTAGYAVIIKKQ